MSFLFSPLSSESLSLTERLPGLIDETFPLPGRFRAALPRDVAELSRLLTADRTERNSSYLGRPAALSAYLRYYLPWNIYRLCRLFTGLSLNLKAGDAVNDFGAGPLTLAASLWISRPDLRSVPLEFRCLDRTAAALEAGKKFFAALAAETAAGIITGGRDNSPADSDSSGCPWTIKTIRGELKRNGGLSVELRGKPAALSAAVNVYNELFWDFSPYDTEGLEFFAEQQARLLSSLTEKGGSVLVVEPGIPRSGEFISLLRSNFIKEGRGPLSPCTHWGPCPLPGGNYAVSVKAGNGGFRNAEFKARGKAKWCHFVFDAEDAPGELRKLSAAAGLPKERVALSFVFAGPVSRGETAQKEAQEAAREAAQNPPPSSAPPLRAPPVKIRVISDSFPLGAAAEGSGRQKEKGEKDFRGRYGCCERGLVLVNGTKAAIEASPSGALEELAVINGLTDIKSGALMAVKKMPGVKGL